MEPAPLALVLALLASPAAATTVIKIATVAPEGSTWMNLMSELTRQVREETDGRVQLRFYPGGVQGDEHVVLRKMTTGQLHGAGLTGVGLGELAPELRVMDLPLLFRNVEEVHYVLDRMGPVFEEALRKRGYALLGWSEVGFIYLFSKRPVRNAEDLARLKMWLWEGDPVAEAFLDELGVSPVPLAITDVMTGLQTGLVEAVYVSPLAAIALQWFTRVSYMTDLPVTHSVGAVVVREDVLARLDPADREILMRRAREVFSRLNEATEADNEKALRILQERGIRFVTPQADLETELQRLSRRVWDRLVGRLYDRALLDRVVATVAEARAHAASGD
jgi:TRAP-type C4-dicarboxylate transport system substrate-binding protein